MKRKGWRALAIAGALAAALFAWAVPASAYAAVAQVGDVQYDTLDDAVAEAPEGSIIELLQDCNLTQGFNKTLTFTGGHKITINNQLTSNGEAWMCFGLYDSSRVLTFDGVEVEWNSEIGTAPWLMLSLSGTMNVTNGAKVVFTVDSGSTGSRNAIYMNAGSSINVTNGSTFEIHGYGTDGKEGQGIQLDVTGAASINVSGKSHFLIDGTNRGYVNSPSITVDDSTFTVQNCTSNGSNGGQFTATNGAIVTYQNNAGHGLSAGSVTLTGKSTLTADNNGYYGVYSSGGFTVDGTSTLTVTHNSYSGDFAGLKLTAGVTDGRVSKGATVTITDNYCSGLSNNGKVVFEEGVNLTITGNLNDKGTNSHGGGIYNSGASADLTIPSNTVIYNNHAKTDGDDIFSNTTSTITFGQTGSGWTLDGTGIDGAPDDCADAITGWYRDGMDTSGAFDSTKRWEAHADSFDGVYVEPYTFEGSTTTVTGALALKAAHGLGVVAVDPADITVYMGGTDGYESVINDADGGTTSASNSLPEPGFYFVLPENINQAFANAGIAAIGEAADLSEYMTIYTNGYPGANGELHWTLEKYGATYSGANGQFIYRIVPAPTAGQEAVSVRLQFTDTAGNVYTSDTFNPTDSGSLNQHYAMQLYTELVQNDQVVFEVDINGTKYYNAMELQTGDLNIRYVTGDQDSVVTDVVTSEGDLAAAKAASPDQAFALMSDAATYYINGSQVDVTDAAAPSLLFDNVVSDHNTDGADEYDQQLANRAVDVVANAGTSMSNPWFQAKYLDLVDANNGNVWLTSSEPVTVYWPYPAGTDQNTEFHLVHFSGLNREMPNTDISAAIDGAAPEYVTVENTEYGIRFTTDGFSPFVLLWEGQGAQPETPGSTNDGLAATGDGAVFTVAALAAAGSACVGAAYVTRKRAE